MLHGEPDVGDAWEGETAHGVGDADRQRVVAAKREGAERHVIVADDGATPLHLAIGVGDVDGDRRVLGAGR